MLSSAVSPLRLAVGPPTGRLARRGGQSFLCTTRFVFPSGRRIIRPCSAQMNICAEDRPACLVLRSFRSGKYLVRSHPFSDPWRRSPLASWSRWQTKRKTLLPRQPKRARSPPVRRSDSADLSEDPTPPFGVRLGRVRRVFPAPCDPSIFSVQQEGNPTVRSLPAWQKRSPRGRGSVPGVRTVGGRDGPWSSLPGTAAARGTRQEHVDRTKDQDGDGARFERRTRDAEEMGGRRLEWSGTGNSGAGHLL